MPSDSKIKDLDAEIIANQERTIARLRRDLELANDQNVDLWNECVELFNPPDNDSWYPELSIRYAVGFIAKLSCKCPDLAGPPDYEDDPCERCQILGRAKEIPHQR